MSKYLLGVDGGNTKTDYLLCTNEGEFVDVFRTGTCSHEQFDTGMDGMENAMREQLAELFKRNGIDVADITAAGFGLAGADLPWQIDELKKRVESIGFTNFGLANDGILGIKGASGIGLCAVNGTGTVIFGADEKGDILQVGGVGPYSGDAAGGSYIAGQIILSLYNFYYRCGNDSSMFKPLLEYFDVKPDGLLTLVSDYGLARKHTKEINQIGAKAAAEGDTVAQEIFDTIGKSIGHGAAGCIRNLSFGGTVDVILVGSLWHKIPYDGMKTAFLSTTEKLSGKKCNFVKFEAPPAVGGVLWAKEIASKKAVPSDYRDGILQAISMEKYESLVFGKS